MAGEWPIVKVGDLADSISETHGFGRKELIFLNTSDILRGQILHRSYTPVDHWPGQAKKSIRKDDILFSEIRPANGRYACVRKALSDGVIKFITEEQALTLQTINSLRDAAQHHLVDLSEQHLYLHAQSALTLFRDLLKTVFDRDLTTELPERVLPISTTPPADMAPLFDTEIDRIGSLLRPKSRRRLEAFAKIRGLAVLEGAIQGERIQPGTGDLKKLAAKIQSGQSWDKVFPGIASIEFTAKGYGPSLDLRISKKGGIPVQVVPEGTPGAGVVAIKRVDELGFYNLSLTQLADKVGLTGPKTLAFIRHLNLQSDSDCFKQITIGKVKFNRYSQKAIDRIKRELPVVSMDKIWEQYGPKRRKKK